MHVCLCVSHPHISTNNHALLLSHHYTPEASTHAFIHRSYQVPDGEHAVELVSHGIVLHGHEERVEDDADGDGEVQEGVHHHDLHQLLHLKPHRAALPNQVTVGKRVPAGVTLLMGLLQFCTGNKMWSGGTVGKDNCGFLLHKQSYTGSTGK